MSKHFNFKGNPISGLFRIERKGIKDSRGFFNRFFCTEEFKQLGFDKAVAQINHSLTKQKGTIRGMHFQYPPCAETKIVTCIQGKVFDVAVDIRKNSPTFLQWHGEILSEENQISLYIPEGFAHGFQTLTDNCQLLYVHSEFYNSKAEGAMDAFEPALAIKWPLKVTEMSERDRNHNKLESQFKGVEIT